MATQGLLLPIQVQISNLLEIAQQLKQFASSNVLADSLGGKKIDAELAKVLRTLGLIELKSKSAFKTDADFSGLEKDVTKVELSLEKVQTTIANLQFKDLKIPQESVALIEALNAKILELKAGFASFKAGQRDKLLANASFTTSMQNAFGTGEASKILAKNYDDIYNAVKDGMDRVNRELLLLKNRFEENSRIVTQNTEGKANFTAWGALEWLLKAFEQLPKDHAKMNDLQKVMADFMKINPETNAFDGWQRGAVGLNGFYKHLIDSLHLDPSLVAEIRRRILEAMKEFNRTALEELLKIATDPAEGARIFGSTKGISFDSFLASRNQYDQLVKARDTAQLNQGKAEADVEAMRAAWESLKPVQDEVAAQLAALAQALKEPESALLSLLDAIRQSVTTAPELGAAYGQATLRLNELRLAANAGKALLANLDLTLNKLLGLSNFVTRYVGIYAIIRRVSTAIRNAFTNIKELDKTITNIAVVTNMSLKDLWAKIGEYTSMALQYGVATKDVYTVSQIFYQQGLKTSLVMSLTTETLKMAKISGMDYSQAANAMTVAIRAFKIEMTDALSVTDTYSALAAKFAVSSAEIANAMEKTASSAANVGMSLLSTSAFISVMEQTTREGAQNIGSALKSIISRYGEMKASPNTLLDVDGEEVAFNKVDTALKSIGISIKNASGQFRDFDDVILELASKWDTLDNNTQRYIATVMAGNRQQSRFIALVSNYDELKRAISVADNAENASIIQVGKTMDSLESKANQLKNAFSQIYLDLHVEDGLKSMYDWLTRILKTIGRLGVLKGALPTLANLIGFGTGTKSLINLAKMSITEKLKKVNLNTSEAELKAKELEDILTRPVTKKVTVDDSAVTASNAATTATLTAQQLASDPGVASAMSTQLINNLSMANPKMTDAAILSSLYTALAEGKLNSEAGIRSYMSEEMHMDPDTLIGYDTFTALLGLAAAAQNAATNLNTAGTSAGSASTELTNLGNTSTLVATGEQTKLSAAALAALADLEKATSAKEAAYEDVLKAIAEQRAAVAVDAETLARLLDAVTSKATTYANAVAKEQEARASYNNIVAKELEAQGSRNSGQAEDEEARSSRNAAAADEEEAGASRNASGSSHLYSTTLMKGIGVAAGVSRIIGTLITAAGAAHQDKSTDDVETSKLLTGLGNGISMAGTGASMGMAFGPWGALIGGVAGLLLGGLPAFIDGLHMDTKERLALLKDEAEASKNESLKQQSTVLDLTSSIENIKALKKTMYDSEEDMLAYKDAMNSMAEAYPELVTAYDSAGNAIIDLVAAEKKLMEARHQSSSAAVDAAKDELEVIKTKRKLIIESTDAKYLPAEVKSTADMNLGELIVDRFNPNGVYWSSRGQNKYMRYIPGLGDIESQKKWFEDVKEELGLTGMTASLFFGWDTMSPTATVEQRALQGKLRIEALLEQYDIKLAAATKSYEKALNLEALDAKLLTSSLTTATQLKISENSIFTSMVGSRANYYSELPQYENKTDNEIRMMAAERIMNWAATLTPTLLDEFINDTSDLTTYLSAGDIISKYKIYDPDAAAGLVEAFIDANKDNCEYILKTIYKTDTKGNLIVSDGSYVFNDALTGLAKLNKELTTDIANNFIENNLKIISKYSTFFTEELAKINKLADKGYVTLATNRLNVLHQLSEQLAGLDTTQLNDLFGTITGIDFTSLESISDAYSKVLAYAKKNGLENDSNILAMLTTLSSAMTDLVYNITTIASTLTTLIEKAAKEIDSILSTNKSGLSLDKALSELKEINAAAEEGMSYSFNELFSYDAVLGKYVYTRLGLTKAIKRQEKRMAETRALLLTSAEMYKTLAGEVPEWKFTPTLTDTSLHTTKTTDINTLPMTLENLLKYTGLALTTSAEATGDMLQGLQEAIELMEQWQLEYLTTIPEAERTYAGYADFMNAKRAEFLKNFMATHNMALNITEYDPEGYQTAFFSDAVLKSFRESGTLSDYFMGNYIRGSKYHYPTSYILSEDIETPIEGLQEVKTQLPLTGANLLAHSIKGYALDSQVAELYKQWTDEYCELYEEDARTYESYVEFMEQRRIDYIMSYVPEDQKASVRAKIEADEFGGFSNARNATTVRNAAGIGRMDTRSQLIEGAFALHFEAPEEIPYETTYVIPEGVDLTTEPMFSTSDELIAFALDRYSNPELAGYFEQLAVKFFETYTKSEDWTWEKFIEFLKSETGEMEKEAALALEEEEAYLANTKNQIYQAIDWSKLVLKTDNTGRNTMMLRMLGEELGLYIYDEATQVGSWIEGYSDEAWDQVLEAYLTDLYAIKDEKGNIINAEELPGLVANAKNLIMGQFKSSASDQVSTAVNEILNGGGQVLSETTLALVEGREDLTIEDGILKAGTNFIETAKALYNDYASNLLSLSDKNTTYSAILNKKFELPNQAITALTSAASMDMSTLTDTFTKFGLELAQWYNGESWQNGLEAAMSTNAFGKTTIVDWDMFLATTGISLSDEILSSFEYQNAYSSYVDGMITLDTQMVELIKKNYDNAFSTITEWKPVNISKLAQNEALVEKLTKNNAAVIDGGQLIVKDAIEYAKNTSELFIALSSADTGWLYENTGWTKADIAKNWKNAQTVITEVQDTWTALAENISSINTDSISTLVEKGNFDLSKLTTDAFTKIGDTYVLKLENYREYLIEAIGGAGATYEGLNPNQLKKVDEAYNKAEQAIVNKINGLDWAKILDGTATAADLDTFVKGLQESLASLGIALSTYYNADGTLNLNALIGALQDLNTEASKEIIKNITNNIATTRDNVLTAIETAMSHTMSGTKNLSDIEKFIESYNKLNPEDTIDISAFSYDSDLQQFTLSGNVLKKYIESLKKVLQELGLSNAAIDAYIKDQTETLLLLEMDITSLLEAKDSKEQKDAASKLKTAVLNYLDLGNVIYADLSLTPERVEEIKKLISELYAKDEAATSMEEASSYYRAAEELERSLRTMTANEIVNALYKGGAEAAEILARIKGDEVTSEELSAVYNAGVNRIKAAEEALSSGVGTTLTGLAADIASTTDGIETAELPDGSVVITAVTDMTQAYVNLYQQMAATAEATTADLNSMFAKVLTAKDLGNIDAIQTLSDAMGMDYDSLGKLLAQYGKDEWSSLEYMMLHQYTAGIEALGNGKVRIVDWKKFSSQMNWEVGGEAYMEAYNAYNDSLIELDRKVGKQIVEEIKNVSDAKTGDRINITYLTEAIEGGENAINAALLGMGAEVKDGILTIKNGAQIGNIIATLANLAKNSGQAITSELAELADAVESFLDNIVNLIKNGISGSLKNSEANTLKEWAKTYAGIEDLDFTRTAEGLQLSEQSAIALYAALKKVDSVKASLVFDELSDSLQKNNDNFKSVSALMGHIRKISLGVYEADGKTSKARLLQYEAELAVAKEILAVRSTQEDDSFNFMSNKIPAAQNNPLNYAKNWTLALLTIRDAFSTGPKKNGQRGFIDYEDWYNIANEINNMAAVTGKEITIGALTFKGDLESASAAIQAGAESLTTVDTGDLKVNLASVGIGIKSGADAMTDGITEGIQGVAKALVAALDGLIAMLELIVAMEQLGDIDTDSNGIDLSDLFEVTYDEDGNKQVNYEKLSADYEKWVNDIKDKINKDSANYNEDLAKAVNGIKIDGHALVDMLDWTPGQFTDPANANVAKAYAAMLDAFNKAALSGNYDLDNIQLSVLQVLAESGFDDTVTLDIGDMTYVISAGTMTTIDWTDTDTDKILTELAAKEKTDKTNARAKLTTWIQKYGSGEPLGEAELHYVLLVKKKITMEDGKVTSVVVGGKTYNTTNSSLTELDAAVNAAVLEDFGYDVTDWKVKEGTEHTVEVETKIGNKTIKVESENGQVRLVSADGKRKYKNQAEFLEGEYHQWIAENTGKSREGMYKSLEEWQWGEYRVATKVDPKFVIESTGETVTPDSDPNLRSQLTDILNGGHDAVAKYFNEHATDNKNGTYTVDIGGYQFTFTGGENAITNFENAIGEQLGIDVGLSNTISTAIANAFANQDVKDSVADAIKTGMQNALSPIEGETTEIPVPAITLKPSEINIDTSGITPAEGTTSDSLGLNLDQLTAVVTSFSTTGDPNELVNTLSAIVASYTGTGDPNELVNALTACVTAYTNSGTPDDLVNALRAVITTFSATGDPNLLVNALAAIITSYTNGGDPSSLVSALTAYISEYNDEGATKPTLDELTQFINDINTNGADAALEAWRTLLEAKSLVIPVEYDNDRRPARLPGEAPKWYGNDTTDLMIYAREFSDWAGELALHIYLTGEEGNPYGTDFEYIPRYGQSYEGVNLPEGWILGNDGRLYTDNIPTTNYEREAADGGWEFVSPEGETITLTGEVEELDTSAVEDEEITLDATVKPTSKENGTPEGKTGADSSASSDISQLGNTAADAATDTSTLGTEAYTASQHVSKMGELAGGAETEVQNLGTAATAAAEALANLNKPDSEKKGETSEVLDTSAIDDAAESLNNAASAALGASAAADAEASSQEGLSGAISTAGESAGSAAPQIQTLSSSEISAGGSASSAAGSISGLAGAIRSIPGHTSHNIQLNLNAKVTSTEGKGTVSLTSLTPRSINALSFAKGNARAGGQSTLMGELGPELVVSNGQYFIVGQGGAEFVDLAPDAIVFNHKQTALLLSNGKAGRGKPVTNEDKAISWAKGNTNGGPAMASASAALAALKQLRAQWKALEALSAKDLAGKAGGGGGGGSKNAAFIKQLERWYNLLQEIATLEQKITYEQAKRSKIQSSFNKSGKEYFLSQKDSLKYLEAEVLRHQQLADEQLEYFEKRRAELNKQSAFSELYTFDENGQIKYKEGKFEELSERFGGDSTTGKPNYSVKEQYDWLKALGYGYAMEYNENGEKIEIKDDKDEAGMKSAIEAFWAKIDSDKSEMQELHDSIEEHKKAVLEKQQAQNEILKEIEDNLLAVENKVLKALEDAEKRKIDELQKLKDAIEKGNENLIKGLTELLDIERRMYQSQESQAELESKRRKLAILQRSGGSAAEINSLQKEIDNDAREEYFNKQQEQIDTIQLASDNELEKLQQQIDLMTETLEYLKENGLLWAQVYEVMARSPEEIADYIKANDSSYWGKSPADLARSMRDDLFEAEKWAAFAAEGVDIKDYVAKIAELVTAEDKAKKKLQESSESGSSGGSDDSSGSGGGGGNTDTKPALTPKTPGKNKTYTVSVNGTSKTFTDLKAAQLYYNSAIGGYASSFVQGNLMLVGVGKKYKDAAALNAAATAYAKGIVKKSGFKEGGLVTDTGLAMVHGSKAKPEAVLNAEQTKILRDNILSTKPDSLISLLKSYNEAYHGLSSTAYDSISDNSNSVVIEHAEVNMHVAKMDNSYDAAKAGDDVMREILHIASKTPVRNRIS